MEFLLSMYACRRGGPKIFVIRWKILFDKRSRFSFFMRKVLWFFIISSCDHFATLVQSSGIHWANEKIYIYICVSFQYNGVSKIFLFVQKKIRLLFLMFLIFVTFMDLKLCSVIIASYVTSISSINPWRCRKRWNDSRKK